MGSSSSCITECGGSDCRPLVQRLIREPEEKDTVLRYAHAEATATPEGTCSTSSQVTEGTSSTWGSQMPPLPPVQPGLVLHHGILQDEAIEIPKKSGCQQAIGTITKDLVRGRTLPVLALNGNAVECFVAMDKQLHYMVIQRLGKKESKRRALALDTVEQVCVGTDAAEESGLPLQENCVCLILREGQAIAFVLKSVEERDNFAMVMSMLVDQHGESELESCGTQVTMPPAVPAA
ncbi:unnamed protein product [Effrenium voratum]|uniref:Uncharacterized protein n=1 Tax=Effrenium voratum TaxID=2562239 RepID=A0AA36JN83_9DINO|nr:unnamed protein product [Effrenium voratum]CAJ1443286.1 unnamed protein product [Effrenium voratum]